MAATSCSRGAWRSSPRVGRRSRPTRFGAPAKPNRCADLEHATELKSAIEALGPVSLPVKTAADSGKLFGSVTAGDIVGAIKKAGGPNLDKRIVRLPKAHIKAVGTHRVSVHLHPEVDLEVAVDVVADS